MANEARVAGVGMIPFTKPGQSETYDVMGRKAAAAAFADAGLPYSAAQQVYVGYVYGNSTAGQAAVYGLGLTGVPIINVNNNCSTGSSALFLARQAVASGVVDCALALGFEEMRPGALGSTFNDRPNPMQRQTAVMTSLQEIDPKAPFAAQFFGGAGQEYADRYGTRRETFAKIASKARTHAQHNPYAIFKDPLNVEEVLGSPQIYGPLTRFQCCPPTCGAAAAVVCTPQFARRHGIKAEVVIKAQAMTTDTPSTFEDRSMIKVIGFDMAKAAADQVYEAAGVGPGDVQVVELHDCFTANELLTYEAIGLTPEGTAEKFIWDGDNTYGGKVVTNPSGGLLSKGHPLGATGLAQCAELVWQLRGQADKRQVEGVTHALQHNLGLGGACVVTLYGRGLTMLDRSFIGFESPPRSVAVEAGQLRFFARATGETNPVYFDEAAARAAGHSALPAPPTFLFCLSSLAPDGQSVMATLGLDMGRVLHGEQSFTAGAPIHAGDVITLKSRISDIYDKRGGALDFIVEDTRATNQVGVAVGAARTVIVVRNA